jgi:hypothetical protein
VFLKGFCVGEWDVSDVYVCLDVWEGILCVCVGWLDWCVWVGGSVDTHSPTTIIKPTCAPRSPPR